MRIIFYLLFLCAVPVLGFAQTAQSLGIIDNNYWEDGGGSPATIPLSQTISPFNAPFEGVSYTSGIVNNTTSRYTSSGVYCSSGVGEFNKHMSQVPQSLASSDTCFDSFLRANDLLGKSLYQEAYDTARRFIEACPLHEKSDNAFSMVSSANYGRSDDRTRFTECREWLKTVLYLNPDTVYYCADVGAIMETFFWFNDERGTDYNGSNTVVKYLIENNRCPHAQEWLINGYEANRKEQIKHYRDTVQDSIETPIDTTLPSLEDLDLGILRGPTGSVATTSGEPHLGDLIATRNPFTDILELKYRLDKSAMVRIDVYDLLGRVVYSEGQGYKAEGEHVLSLQSKGWSSGSYYVRLSSPSGEVKTVKVVKE